MLNTSLYQRRDQRCWRNMFTSTNGVRMRSWEQDANVWLPPMRSGNGRESDVGSELEGDFFARLLDINELTKSSLSTYRVCERSHAQRPKDKEDRLHWCAKIKDEVEKLAYQLNEEAERTERPIRRLSKVMYGSTCVDMQLLPQRERVNNQSVRRHLEAFTRSRIIGKLEEGRSVTSVAAEFGIAHSIVSRLWRQFQTTGTAIRGFSSGRPRGTTPADDQYIVLQARRNRRQTAGEIARHMTQATGRPISRFTVARRLHGGGLFARRPVRCVPLTPAHRRKRSLWCREHRN
ncbi:HTH_Tnp_Tc3_2 domain-containing protein [Trichonephila clavipes]|nr:HTH_Tnp_Tc3_2 domain-containing protein [Trichonephila clavipes]